MEFVIKQCVDVLNKHCEVHDPNYVDKNKNYQLIDIDWYVLPVKWTDLDLQPNNHRTYCYKQQHIYRNIETLNDNDYEPGELCYTCRKELGILEMIQNSESHLLDLLITELDFLFEFNSV